MYKRIAIDIDNTLTELDYVLEVMADYYGKEVPTVEMIKDYNLSSVYGISPDEAYSFWIDKELEICEKSVLAEDRVENMLRQFVEFDTEVYIITNRHPRYFNATQKWLIENYIPHKRLIMTGGGSKIDVLNQYDIELLIDDKPSIFYEAVEKGYRGLMICIDYEYNKEVPCDIRLDREGMETSVY